MNKTNIALGIGLVLAVLAVLAVFTAAAAANTAYFVPQHSNATTGNDTWVYLYLDVDAGQHIAATDLQIQFDPAHANITRMSKGCGVPAEGKTCWATLNDNFSFTENGYMWGGLSVPQVAAWEPDEGYWYWDNIMYFEGPMTLQICRYKVEAVGTPGESPFNFGFEMFPGGCSLCQKCLFSTEMGVLGSWS